MSSFRFGLLRVEVDREPPESHDRDVYLIQIVGPGALRSESKISVRKQPRSTGTDFELATYMLEELKQAARDPKGWLALAQAESAMSSEEILETLLFAEDVEPYLKEATEAAHQRSSMYHGEHPGLVLGIGRILELPKHVRTKEDMANFFAYLYLVDHTSFHPDDRFSEYVTCEGRKAYTRGEAAKRQHLMNQSWEVAKKNSLDIYEVSLWVGALVGASDPDVAADEDAPPKWLVDLSKYWV